MIEIKDILILIMEAVTNALIKKGNTIPKKKVRIGNKAFHKFLKNILKMLDIDTFAIRVPLQYGRETTMFFTTNIISLLMQVLIKLLQVQMLVKPPPLSDLYTTPSSVTIDGLKTALNTVLAKNIMGNNEREDFLLKRDESYRLVKYELQTSMKDYYKYIFPEDFRGQFIIIAEQFTSIFGNMGDIVGLLLENADNIMIFLTEIMRVILKSQGIEMTDIEMPSSRSLSPSFPHSQLLTGKLTESVNQAQSQALETYTKKMAELEQKPLTTGTEVSQADAFNLLKDLMESIVYSSPIIFVINFMVAFMTYTIGKLIEIGLKMMIERLSPNAPIPKLSDLLSTNQQTSKNAFLALFAVMNDKKNTEQIVSIFLSMISMIKDTINVVLIYYQENVPDEMRDHIHKIFSKILTAIITVLSMNEGVDMMAVNLLKTSATQVGLLNATSIVDGVRKEFNEGYEKGLEEQKLALDLKIAEEIKKKEILHQTTKSSIPAPAQAAGGKIRKSKKHRNNDTYKKRIKLDGKIRKSIKEFYDTNKVYKRFTKRRKQ